MTNYTRTCPNRCGEAGSSTPVFLINPKRGDIVKCPICGAEYEIGMRPFLISRKGKAK